MNSYGFAGIIFLSASLVGKVLLVLSTAIVVITLDIWIWLLFFCLVLINIGINNYIERKNAKLGLEEVPEKRKEEYIYQLGNEVQFGKEMLDSVEGQKLALCRAYYKNSPFIILDEPTSALDIKAECEIYYNFQTLVQGKTALFISHRLASSRICDKVLVFQKGRLVEQGNHKELMEQGGLYKELFQMQAKYFEAVYPCGF